MTPDRLAEIRRIAEWTAAVRAGGPRAAAARAPEFYGASSLADGLSDLLAEVDRLTAVLDSATTLADRIPSQAAFADGAVWTDSRVSALQAELHAARQR